MKKIKWTQKHLLGLKDLTAQEITIILDTAKSFVEISERAIKKVPTLRGKTICNFFFEPSTRTRASFEIAEKRLSADTLNIAGASSSLVKGESVKDMARNIEALKVDMIVIRHSSSGIPHQLSHYVNASIINAGDGINEHPTQALLDMFTMREKKGTIKGLNVSLIGDILHSRVVRSNIWGLTKLGAQVTVCGPRTLIPAGIEQLGVRVTNNVIEAVEGADAIMLLRIQRERQDEIFFPTIREYSRTFQVNSQVLKNAKKNVIIMHPGPINRGVELADDIADSAYSVILNQVTNGIAVRMAVLYLLSGVKQEEGAAK
ncbi:MAG: aspartate carbamoyltransferase catalytic subunit [Candidatus Omnitrophica bacterium]|nr:aspartate carbamoyltransferase catalytic subunit [Candidatus Omnitrophota bacterium]